MITSEEVRQMSEEEIIVMMYNIINSHKVIIPNFFTERHIGDIFRAEENYEYISMEMIQDAVEGDELTYDILDNAWDQINNDDEFIESIKQEKRNTKIDNLLK